MKTLLITLAFAIGVLDSVPARAAVLSQSVSVSASVALSDTIAPAKVKTTNLKKTEVLSALSLFAATASVNTAFSAGGSILFLYLAIFSIAVGTLELARIRKSQGQLGGRLLAKLGIIVSVTWLVLIGALALALRSSLHGR